jgi:hypothetical protein
MAIALGNVEGWRPTKVDEKFRDALALREGRG